MLKLAGMTEPLADQLMAFLAELRPRTARTRVAAAQG